jgi:hypothetical protein
MPKYRGLIMSDKEQWYTNKDLHAQITSLSGQIKDLGHEMKETRTMIKQYNGLREKIGIVEEKVEKIEAKTEGRKSVGEAIRLWGGWLFALITLVILLIDKF